MTERRTYRLVYWFLITILTIMPFWSAIIAFISDRSALDYFQIFAVRSWYEPVLLILFMLVVFNPRWEKRGLELKVFDYLIFIYLIWSIISIFCNHLTISQGIQGLRYNGLFFGFYLLARFSFFSEARIQFAENLVLIFGRVLSLWAIIEVVFLRSDYWQRLGILSADSGFGFGATHTVVSVPQAMATMEGPNQLGSFLLLPFFIALSRKSKNPNRALTDWLWLIIIAGAIVLSFSRSAILGLIVGLIFFLIFDRKMAIKEKIILSFTPIILGALSVAYFINRGGGLRDFWTHGASNQSHWYSMYQALVSDRTIPELFFGSGIGTAGPASFNFIGNIQESWYLQIITELGLIGFLLWLSIVVLITINFFKKNRALSLGLISVSVAAIFLHTFADNPVLSFTLFILLGMQLGQSFEKLKPPIKFKQSSK